MNQIVEQLEQDLKFTKQKNKEIDEINKSLQDASNRIVTLNNKHLSKIASLEKSLKESLGKLLIYLVH